MAVIPDQKSLILQEEADYRSALSEAFFTKIGGLTNHIFNRQLFYKEFICNGDYRTGGGIVGFDGIFTPVFDYEIVSIQFSNVVSGSSGTTEIDVHLIDSGGDQGTIFSTKPSIDSTASDNVIAVKSFITTQAGDISPTGTVLPALSVTNEFSAGEGLRVDLDTVMTGARNFNLTISYRPR